MSLEILLRFLGFVPQVVAKLPAFVALFEDARRLLEPADQDVAKEALADIQADNDEGHARLQDKLAAAARR